MSSEVFNLAIHLTLKDNASTGLDRFGAKLHSSAAGVNRDLQSIEKQYNKLQQTLKRDLAIGGVGVAGLALMNKGIGSAATLEDSIFELRKAFQEDIRFSSFSTEQQEAQMKKLIALATELGGNLQGDTRSYIDLFSSLNRAGVDAEITLTGAGKAAAYLANVTGAIRKGTAPQLAEDLGSFGKMFDLQGKEWERAVQLFAALEDRFNIASGSLVESSKYFFSTAKGVMDLRGIEGAMETAKLFAFMKRYAGREGSEAGTSLDALISQYVGHQDKFQKLTKNTGIKLELFDTKGQFKGVENMFAQMEKMRKLNPAERGDWMTYLFREQGSRVAQAMVEQGVAGWKNVTNEANKSVDVNTQIIQQMDTYNAKVEALTGSWENFKASAFTPLMEDAKIFVDYGSNIVNTLQSFSANNQGLMETLGTIALYGSTALVAYSGVKTLVTGIRLLSITSKFSKGEGLLPYLTGVREEATRTATVVAGFTRPLDTAKSRVAGFVRPLETANTQAGKLKGTLQSIAGSSAFKIGVDIAAITAAEVALTSLIQMWSEAAEKSRQMMEHAKEIRGEYNSLMGRGKLYGAPGDYGNSSGSKDELDVLANKFIEAIKKGRDLETSFNPDRKTWWEFFTNPTPYGMAKNQSQFSGIQFNPDVAANTWRQAGITQPIHDPNVLARVLVQLQKDGGGMNLNIEQIALLTQALEKVATTADMDIARGLAQKELYGEKKPEVAPRSIYDTLRPLNQPILPQNRFQLPMMQGVQPFTVSPPSIRPFGEQQRFGRQIFETQKKPAYPIPDFSGKQSFSITPIIQNLVDLQKPIQPLQVDFTNLSGAVNQAQQSILALNQQSPNTGFEQFSQSLQDLVSPIPQTQQNIFNLGDTSGKAVTPIGGLVSAALRVSGGLNNVGSQLANWKAPVPQVTTYSIGVPSGTTGSPVVGVLPPQKASGGTVMSEGLVYIHKGEDIVPASVTSQYRQPPAFANFFGYKPPNRQTDNFSTIENHFKNSSVSDNHAIFFNQMGNLLKNNIGYHLESFSNRNSFAQNTHSGINDFAVQNLNPAFLPKINLKSELFNSHSFDKTSTPNAYFERLPSLSIVEESKKREANLEKIPQSTQQRESAKSNSQPPNVTFNFEINVPPSAKASETSENTLREFKKLKPEIERMLSDILRKGSERH